MYETMTEKYHRIHADHNQTSPGVFRCNIKLSIAPGFNRCGNINLGVRGFVWCLHNTCSSIPDSSLGLEG